MATYETEDELYAALQETKEPQYQLLLDVRKKHGIAKIGLMLNEAWQQDPRRLIFVLSRYKFVSKMLSGKGRVLEVGCADSFATRVVQQEVGAITAVDFDPLLIESAKLQMSEHWPLDLRVHDMVSGPLADKFEAAYALDVLEHISAESERAFLGNISASLDAQGVLIIGMPSLESQDYASPQSKEGHINCKTAPDLRALMLELFHNVFMFSMNDEVVHTGYHKMAHYIFAVGVGKR